MVNEVVKVIGELVGLLLLLVGLPMMLISLWYFSIEFYTNIKDYILRKNR